MSITQGLRDEQLAELYRNTGDQSYFDQIHARWNEPITKFLETYVNRSRRDVDQAAIVDEVFYDFHVTCLRGVIENVGAWLFQAARTCAHQALRHGQRLKRDCRLQDRLTSDVVDLADGPVAVAERRDVMTLIHANIGKLSQQEQDAVRMIYLAGRTLEAAAADLGISLATVKRRVRRGLDNLRRDVDAQLFDTL